MGFGNRFKKIRKQHGMTQADVADGLRRVTDGKIDLSQAAISNIEQKHVAPRGEIVLALAQLFHLHPSHFYLDDDKSPVQVDQYIYALRMYTPDDPRRFNFEPVNLLYGNVQDEYMDME